MSFELSFYKDHLLNKAAEFKDRASAILSQLDNCHVRLDIKTSTSKKDSSTLKAPGDQVDMGRCKADNKGDLVRKNSKSKSKHSRYRKEERVYKLQQQKDEASDSSSDSSDDSDSDSDTDSSDDDRGRSPHHVVMPVCVHGCDRHGHMQQNVNQQNFNVLPQHWGEARGRSNSRHKRRDKSRDRHKHGKKHAVKGQNPKVKHKDGCHGANGVRQLKICGAGMHGKKQGRPQDSQVQQANHFGHDQVIRVEDEDGRWNFYTTNKLMKTLKDAAESHARQLKEQEAAKQKKITNAMDIINKLTKQNDGGVPMIERSQGWMWPNNLFVNGRSVEDIQHDLNRLIADREQLRADVAIGRFSGHQRECDPCTDQLAMCRGALGESDEEADDHEQRPCHVPKLTGKQLKPILKKPK